MTHSITLPCDCANPRVVVFQACVERRVEHSGKPRTVEALRCTCGKCHDVTLSECPGCRRLHLRLPGWDGSVTFAKSNTLAPL